ARAAEFLTVPVGARGTALGSAFAATADDITAIYWNPAGLGFMETPQAFYTFVNMPLNVNLSYAAIATPVFGGTGVLGAFFELLDLPSQEVTTVLQPEGTDFTFESNSLAGGLSYAHNFSDRFSAGVTTKIVNESISDVSGTALAFDFGSNYHTTLFGRSVRLAFVVQNLGGEMQLSGERLFFNVNPDELDERDNINSPTVDLPDNLFPRRDRGGEQQAGSFNLPAVFKTGVSYAVVEEGGNNLTLAGEFWNPNNQEEVFALGAEFRRDLALTGGGTEGAEGRNAAVSLRGGWFFQQDEIGLSDSANDGDNLRGLSFGAGIQYDFGLFDAGIDYAYRDLGRITQNNLFSVSVGL
ncbi:MAG: PorV/PorQ family protein, partial [Gemmatimonadales bacterium]|nr:PorV/PorQ family protein [Gemmatimonadales bacterium]